jgi:thioredoxin 1
MAFKDGVLVFSQAGALPATSLEQLVTAVRELDVDVEMEKARAADAAEERSA